MRVHGNLSELIVQVAASEAVAAGFTEITTAHLVMALCRLSEARAPGEPGRDTRALREELAGLGIEPTTFRRRLRELVGRRGDPREISGVLHRTERCKAVFERAARCPDGELPALLHAAFSSLFDLGIAQGDGQEEEANGESVPPLGVLTGRFRALRKFLADAVHGQDHAVHKLAEGLFEVEMVPASGARRGPRGLFVFAGPPGVGKTHLAELTAGFLDRHFKQFDLSAYSQGHEVGFLVGSPASFRGAAPGALTDFVSRNPGAILIFDEIEKASPAVIQLFLQILDAGTVDDQFTRESVDFRRAILILTSNGARSLYEDRNAAGVHQANAGFYRSALLDALSTEADPRTGLPLFPPAICSRLATGHLILFHHLSTSALVRVAGAAMEEAAALLQASFGQRYTWSDEVPLALVMREGPWVDARSVRARGSAFLKDEVAKVCRLWTDEHIDRAFGEIEEVRVEVDAAEAGEMAARLFYDQESPRVLLIATAPFRERLESAPGVAWRSSEDAGEALGLLAKDDFDFVLLDLTAKTSTAESAAVFDDVSSFQGPGATELHFDYRPLAARRFAAGQSLLRRLRTRFPEVAVYLLSPAGDPGDSEDEWLAASVEAGGARGVLRFSEDGSGEEITEEVRRLSRRLRMERMAAELARSHQAVLFDTAPLLAEDRRRLRLRCRHFRRVRAVRGADRESVLSEVERPAVRFGDVVGAAAAKQSLAFLRDYLREPRKYAASGVEVPRGVLLAGPPGTGKTLLARALAGECDCPFLPETATGFVTVWQGSGPENVRRLFARARRYAPSIVFLDEIDALGRRRRGAAGAGHGEEMALNALLTELDGFAGSTSRPVVTVAATNLPELLDPALVRRFARVVEVELPTRAERESFLALRLNGKGARRVSAGVVSRIGAQTQGRTIADLERMLAEAAVLGLDGGAGIDDDVLIEAFERVTLGDPKKTAADPLRTARHEAGHALALCELGSPPAYVSIVGRGHFAGYTALDLSRGRALTTKPELEDLLCQILAGREAERLFFGDEEGSSAGQVSDLERATEIAEAMVYELGMDPEVGFVRLDRRRPMAAPAAELCHSRVRSVLEDQGKRARAILERRRDALERVAESLLERGRLTQDDLLALVSTAASGATGSLP